MKRSIMGRMSSEIAAATVTGESDASMARDYLTRLPGVARSDVLALDLVWGAIVVLLVLVAMFEPWVLPALLLVGVHWRMSKRLARRALVGTARELLGHTNTYVVTNQGLSRSRNGIATFVPFSCIDFVDVHDTGIDISYSEGRWHLPSAGFDSPELLIKFTTSLDWALRLNRESATPR